MIIPTAHIAASSQDQSPPGLVIEVEREVFLGLLAQGEKPLVFEHRSGLPRTYRYLTRIGAYFFLYRNREQVDLKDRANVLPVKGFHAGPPAIV